MTSALFLSVTKLLMTAFRTGSMESGGTMSWAAWAENCRSRITSLWWGARNLGWQGHVVGLIWWGLVV